jgi:hypothetical protein
MISLQYDNNMLLPMLVDEEKGVRLMTGMINDWDSERLFKYQNQKKNITSTEPEPTNREEPSETCLT